MKKKDINKYKEMDLSELRVELEKKRKEMGKIKLEMITNPAKDTNIIRKMKKEQAVILTVINEKESTIKNKKLKIT